MWYICIFDIWVHIQGAGEYYFNSRVCIYSSDLAYAVALSVTKVNNKTIWSNFPIPVINRNSNRKEPKDLGLSKHILVNDCCDHRSKFTKQFWTSCLYNSTSVGAELSLEWSFLSIIPANWPFKTTSFCGILSGERGPSSLLSSSNVHPLEWMKSHENLCLITN